MKYLNQLSADEIRKFLGDNGVTVLEDLEDLIKDANESNGDCYYIRCGRFGEQNRFNRILGDLNDFIVKKSKIDKIFKSNYFDDRLDIYAMTDFSVYRVFAHDFPNESDYALQKNYNKFMNEKFNESNYTNDYIEFYNELEK